MAQNRFREALEAGRFAVTCECVPGRGAHEVAQQKAFDTACELWETGRVDAISVTDNPGGNPALLPDSFAADLLKSGVEPLVHLSCKDRNRNQFESQFYAMQRAGIENVLCMSGDCPSRGWNGTPRSVFDLDSVTLVQMVSALNRGMGYPSPRGGIERTEASNFFCGAVVSPFKWTEAETMTQLFKLKKKVEAGADYVICQVGYDARKMQEMLMMARDAGIDVPFIANVFVTSAGTGALMNKGAFPGCDVTDELLAVLKAERDASDDKGRETRLQRAAKTIAIARGLGFAGVHIGGIGVNAESLNHMLDLADGYADGWLDLVGDLSFAQKGCFYYYEADPATGLNAPEPVLRTETATGRDVMGNYRLSRRAHHLFFMPGKGLNGLFRAREESLERKKGRLRPHGLEHMGKALLYGCMDCGDCGLYATAYSCPMVECPKCQRNGPCGGSKDGWCEAYPGEKRCIWFKAYHRLKAYGEQDSLASYIVPPNDWANFAKSPWGANSIGRDGYARREWMPGVDPDEESIKGPKPPEDAPRREY